MICAENDKPISGFPLNRDQITNVHDFYLCKQYSRDPLTAYSIFLNICVLGIFNMNAYSEQSNRLTLMLARVVGFQLYF